MGRTSRSGGRGYHAPLARLVTMASLLRIGAIALLVALAGVAQAFDPSSPVGLWETLDQKTGLRQALIRLDERDGKVSGRIVWTDNPEDATNTCTHCKDERRNAPILGLVLIRDLEHVGAAWENGDILDPRNGAVYRCKVWLEDDGRVLVVRGYVGVSLLGGSRRWRRVA